MTAEAAQKVWRDSAFDFNDPQAADYLCRFYQTMAP